MGGIDEYCKVKRAKVVYGSDIIKYSSHIMKGVRTELDVVLESVAHVVELPSEDMSGLGMTVQNEDALHCMNIFENVVAKRGIVSRLE